MHEQQRERVARVLDHETWAGSAVPPPCQRLLDRQTGRLEPLLAEGMQPEAEARILYARPEHNGVTGFVAASGRSYWCSDTTKDPLYLEGCKGAKSSITVPLMLH
jgi:hypothetical protein